jgi:hypothetical protein
MLRAPFLEPFEVFFHVAYCYALWVVTRFTRIYPYGGDKGIQSVSSENGAHFLTPLENRCLIQYSRELNTVVRL